MVDKDRVGGAADKAKGAIKEGVGKLTGDQKLQGEGAADKAKGAAKSAVAGIKIRSATRLNVRIDRPAGLEKAAGLPQTFEFVASAFSSLQGPASSF